MAKTEDPWLQVVARARAIWARDNDLPFEAAASMDRFAMEDLAVQELLDEGVQIPEKYRGQD